MELSRILQRAVLSPAEIAQKHRRIYEQVLRQSRCLQRGDFEAIEIRDLQLLYDTYDRIYFAGALRRAMDGTRLHFRLSRRLTSAAGQTTRRTVRFTPAEKLSDYEITISTTLLFQSFQGDDRRVAASGIVCRDRLEALQRVFEHEIVHLSEMLIWSDSKCAAPRFQSIAGRLFGHTQHTHQLITPRERAWIQSGLKVGDRVQFQLHGCRVEGLLNRITRRATVLVEDTQGTRYTDGKHYAKFYVPLALLQKVS